MMFLEVFSEGWDEPDTVDLDKGVLNGVDSIGMDESTSTICIGVWNWGGLNLTTLDELCFTLLS